jgi:hypothetical protein
MNQQVSASTRDVHESRRTPAKLPSIAIVGREPSFPVASREKGRPDLASGCFELRVLQVVLSPQPVFLFSMLKQVERSGVAELQRPVQRPRKDTR